MRQSTHRWRWCSKVALSPRRLFRLQRRFPALERCCDCTKLCRNHFCCVFYRLAVKVITLPLLLLWDPLEITIQCHFPARAAQRPVSGTLVMENYQLAPMKWPLERPLQADRPLPLSTSWFHTAILSMLFSPPSPPETEYEMHLYYRRLVRRQRV